MVRKGAVVPMLARVCVFFFFARFTTMSAMGERVQASET